MSEITLHDVRERLVAAGITGPHQSHSRQNNLSHIRSMLEGDGDLDETAHAQSGLLDCRAAADGVAGRAAVPAQLLAEQRGALACFR